MQQDGKPQRAEGNTRGPLPDNRPKVNFRVEQSVYDVLVAMQSETGLTPDENAGLLMHKLIRNPNGIRAVLDALAPERKPAVDRPTDLATARKVRDGR